MIKKLNSVGSSKTLTLTKDMLAHLGASEVIEIEFKSNGVIVLKKPMNLDEAWQNTTKRFDKALKNLAK